MNLTTRDTVATLLVTTAALTYGLWLAGFLGALSVAAVALVVLTLGFLASASAVVPGFVALLTGSRTYLAIASLFGAVALGSGVLTIANMTESTLAVLVVTTVILWALATVRHANVHAQRQAAVG